MLRRARNISQRFLLLAFLCAYIVKEKRKTIITYFPAVLKSPLHINQGDRILKYKIKKITAQGTKKGELVELASLFDFGIFSEGEERTLVPFEKKRSRARLLFKRVAIALIAFCRTVANSVRDVYLKIKAKRADRPENKLVLPALCGAFVAVTIVTLLSFSIVGYKLLYQNYFGSYKSVAVPDFSGAVYPSDEVFLGVADYCNLSVRYEYNDSALCGEVISQTPAPNIVRRVYRKRSNCNVELVVSLGKKTLVMPALKGLSVRDATLALKNEGLRFSLTQAYSSEVERGKIISSTPSESEDICVDTSVTLVVSLGEKKTMRIVPLIVGMNESQAREAIASAGLSVGKVSYVSSEEGYGRVLWQSAEAYSSAEDGSSVSFSVSAGQGFYQKEIPDLHSLSLEEAKERLNEVGIVIGKVYAVANAAPSGTVVAQFPPAKTPITSDIYSVDVYVSS